jgi:cystathionine beta-synthase
MNAVRKGILPMIGDTPVVEVTGFDTGPCRLFLKLESQNPSGSIKDRIAKSMIEAAEKGGKLKPGGTIVEATAGNTGLGLTLLGGLKGYKVILVVPDKMSREKIAHCKAMGADVRLARSDVVRGHPEYYQDVAARIARENQAFFVNQFSNPANVDAHESGTGPEIYAQLGQDVDAVVCGVGSGGTMTGIGRYFARVSPKTEMVLAGPVGSILEPLVNRNEKVPPGSWLVEGIGEDFIPDILDLKIVKKAYAVSDEESLKTARDLLRKEGILAGPSSGTLIAAALKYCREQKTPKRVVTFVCDRGDKYLSKLYSSSWMAEQGFETRKPSGTVEDLIMRRHDTGDAVFVRPGDTVKTAYKRMRAADVSQLPVLDDDNRLVGVIDEQVVFQALRFQPAAVLEGSVERTMLRDGVFLPPDTDMQAAADILLQRPYIIVADHGRLIGIVTRVDMLNHLYLKGKM